MLESFLNLSARGALLLAGLTGLLLLVSLVVTRRAVLPAVLLTLQALGYALAAVEPRLTSGLQHLIRVLRHLREDAASRRARKAVAA